MKPQALNFVIWGQVCFYTGLVVAILLKPHGLAANAGISYYGIYARTVIPYCVSLLGSAYCSWQSALHIHYDELKPMRNALIIMAILTVIISVTPYSFNNLLDQTHQLAGTVLFSLQLLLSIWIVIRLRYTYWSVVLSAVELLAGIVCAIYLTPAHGFLIQAQILFQLAFGALLVYSLKILPEIPAAKRHLV
jgi:hypothetical protein